MTDWTYDELLLAADLVSRNNWAAVRSTSEGARELSDLLRAAALHGRDDRPDNFRSPKSIQRKTYDLVTAMDGYLGTPTRGGRLSAQVIKEFQESPLEMQLRAQLVRDALEAGERPDQPLEVEEGSAEGSILEHIARRHERDRNLRSRKIDITLRDGRQLDCEVCDFNFESTYGARGVGYIEVHHIVPLHVSGPTVTRLENLALLCANCHRMCHRGAWWTPKELKEIVRAAQ